MISPATRQPDGTLAHHVTSDYQAGDVAIHVLLPDNPDHVANRVLYVLPVEPLDGDQCGDPLAVVRDRDLHNRHQLVCVRPTFSHPPWYADHPTNRQIRQESHFLKVVVPFIDETYCQSTPTRLLLGFSKSGWGAFSLLLRHPDLFARAAAFDSPLAWETPTRYGMAEIFETQSNMDRYCVLDLINRSADTLSGESRLALFGYSDFRSQHQFLHYHLLKLGIPHEYRDGPRRDHRWDSGWVEEAVEFLAGTSADPID